jgi:hypothetical protein
MMTTLEQILSKFNAEGWQQWQAESLTPLDGLFASKYEIVGIVLAETTDLVADQWRKCQEKLSELVAEEREATRDKYLVFVVPKIQEDSDRLREVTSDTQMCRKICIETLGRDIEDALLDLPFFTYAANRIQGKRGKLDPEPHEFLSEDLRRDLAKAHKDTILDKLLSGAYTDYSYDALETSDEN